MSLKRFPKSIQGEIYLNKCLKVERGMKGAGFFIFE
ncbi:hypothetical protein Theco_4008 (plasmid) [Thermobacillus composti KWC4]|jgi:hypothetical protein|uniref:Uncharacterized protein n=1 Tax=Thermobacillus composti (strain DSM 18247 / JCM 13945 / KWC4) TaxID=717605 RepID=L0EKF7_THECK|nr:hypothetical protein Theco_4008 [Thermobacillus composti KWC4]